MNTDEFEGRMRSFEYFHSLRIPPEVWVVIRVDGRSFSRLTEEGFERPFDEKFHSMMVGTSRALLEDLGGLYAFTESDEISVLFRPEWDLFDREVEKVVSISAGIASASFTLACSRAAPFDSRIWIGSGIDAVLDYFRWRQSDAARCALNGWAYWTLRKNGKSMEDATRFLEGKSVDFKNELLFQNGINFNNVPVWQRHGTGIYLEMYEKEGVNPVTGERVLGTRRRVKVDEALPRKEEYSRFLLKLLER